MLAASASLARFEASSSILGILDLTAQPSLGYFPNPFVTVNCLLRRCTCLVPPVLAVRFDGLCLLSNSSNPLHRVSIKVQFSSVHVELIVLSIIFPCVSGFLLLINLKHNFMQLQTSVMIANTRQVPGHKEIL